MKSRRVLYARLFGLAGGLVLLAAFCRWSAYPYFLQITDQAGPWFFTISPADIDLDGDLDVLVHNTRRPGEFEAWSGGTLWINQGGAQGGQAGRFAYRVNDLEGGRDSTLVDLDGDGDLDVPIYDGNRLVVGLNLGGLPGGEAGRFKQHIIVAPPPEHRPVIQFGAVLAGDLNRDGRADAVVLGCCGRAFTENQPNVSWVWFNALDEHGQFARRVVPIDPLHGRPVAEAALGDLDGDGDLDLLAVALKSLADPGLGPGGVVLLNDGAGRFTDSGQRLDTRDSASLALGDLDEDGDLDALLGHGRGASLWINQGGAQGGAPGRFAPAGPDLPWRGTRSARLADLDGDGDLDALVLGRRGAAIWWNDGQGQFTRGAQTLPVSERQGAAAGDFDGDGHLDIFVATYDKAVEVWFNDGKGGFGMRNDE